MKKFNPALALELMLLSRYFEEETERLFISGVLHGTTHLAIGQEASHVGLCMALDKDDWIVPTHRCHGFTLSKGSSPFSMFSEMFGSRYGLAKGIGGSMHMPDLSHKNLGSSAVVGSGVPLACGVGFYLKYKKLNNISVAVFGDGASSRGSVHESMNLCSIWNLPVLFYCENNLYGMSTYVGNAVSVKNISTRALSYSMEGETIDGNNVENVFDSSLKAINYIKEKKKPYLLEVMTYRHKGHSKNDKRIYRTKEEETYYLDKDPIVNFEKYLLEKKIMTETEIKNMEKNCVSFIHEERVKAEKLSSNILSIKELSDLVYASSDYDSISYN